MGTRVFIAGLALLGLALAGCSSVDNEGISLPSPTPSVNETLIPTSPPKDVLDVEPSKFLTSYGDIIFKVGDGPTWCTMSEFDDFVICEHKEFDAKYESLPLPEDCDYTYGYQLRLRGNPVEGSEMAGFTCANAAWSDASTAPVLASGERITSFGFSCFVEEQSARCENSSGDYIVLGPTAWAQSD